MIGRMAPANPWIFRQIEQYRVWAGNARAEGALPSGAKAPSHLSPDGTTEVVPFPCGVYAAGEIPPGLSSSPSPEFLSKSSAKPYEEPTEADRYQMIRTYFRMLLEEEMAGTEGKMKQFASWFTHGIPGGAALRKTIYDAKNGAEILGRVEAFFAARAEDNTEDCDRAIEPAAAEV
jgi:tRNA-dihydrouridine synthase